MVRQYPKITEILARKKFTISVEFIPPRNGEDFEGLFKQIARLKGKVDFISVTKGAGGSLRGGTLTLAYFIQERYGIPTVAHFVCRERTKQEIENELTDLKYFKIKSILALRGDPPAGSEKETWSGDYEYAYLLIDQIKKMNCGRFLPIPAAPTKERKGQPSDFCILAAGHPEEDFAQERNYLKAKIKAGAELLITQMFFSFKDYREYVANLQKAGIKIPVIAGIRPLISFKQAQSAEKFFKIKVAKELKKNLKKYENDPKKSYGYGINYTVDLIRNLRRSGCKGAHLFVLNDVGLVKDILNSLKKTE